MKSYWLISVLSFTACSYRDTERDPLLQSPAKPISIFTPPTHSHVGFDVDGVLHTHVWYGRNAKGELGQFHPLTAHNEIFSTTGRNPAIKALATEWGTKNNTFSLVTHNLAFCSAPEAEKEHFLAESGLPSTLSSANCISNQQPKSKIIKKEKITAFVDDSPVVLEEIAYGAPAVRLYMAFPHHQAVAPYVHRSPLEIERCGMVLVSQNAASKENQVLLQHDTMTKRWKIPSGDCDATLNRHKACTEATPCEDPVTATLRIFQQEPGISTPIQLSSAPRLEVLHVDSLFLLLVKVADTVVNPGFQWFTIKDLEHKKMKPDLNPHISLLIQEYKGNWKEL